MHMLCLFAGKAQNTKASKHMMSVLKTAKQFDTTRFEPQEADDAAAEAAPLRVAVLSSDKVHSLYTLTNPHDKYAACSCDLAVQQQICHHQVAWLLHQSRDAVAAERLIFKKLGLRFGFPNGCSFEGIGELWTELQVQAGSTSAVGTSQGASVPDSNAALIGGAGAPATSNMGATQAAPDGASAPLCSAAGNGSVELHGDAAITSNSSLAAPLGTGDANDSSPAAPQSNDAEELSSGAAMQEDSVAPALQSSGDVGATASDRLVSAEPDSRSAATLSSSAGHSIAQTNAAVTAVQQAAAPQPAGVSDAACNNHIGKLRTMFATACEQYWNAAPHARVNLGSMFESNLANMLHFSSKAAAGNVLAGGAKFQKSGDGCYKRKLSHLEKRSARPAVRTCTNTAPASMPAPAPAAELTATGSKVLAGADAATPRTCQANFAHRSQLDSSTTEYKKTKACDQKRTARQAAQHCQHYHNQQAERAAASSAAKAQPAAPGALSAPSASSARSSTSHKRSVQQQTQQPQRPCLQSAGAAEAAAHSEGDGLWQPPIAQGASQAAAKPRVRRATASQHTSLWGTYDMHMSDSE